MNHLAELLERLNSAKTTYAKADSSMDSSPLQVIVAKQELKEARFAWNQACSDYVMSVIQEDAENTREQYNLEEN